MMNNNDKKEGSFVGGVLGLAVAAVIGAAIGLIFAPKKGEEIKQDILDRAHLIAKNFNKSREDVTKIVKEIFGNVGEDMEKNYIHIRGEVMAMMDDAGKKSKVTKGQYNKIVKDVVNGFSEGTEWTKSTIDKLTKNLVDEWDDLSLEK